MAIFSVALRTTLVSALAVLLVVSGSDVVELVVPLNCRLVPGSTPGATSTTMGRSMGVFGVSGTLVVMTTKPPKSLLYQPLGSTVAPGLKVVLGASVTVTWVWLKSSGGRKPVGR